MALHGVSKTREGLGLGTLDQVGTWTVPGQDLVASIIHARDVRMLLIAVREVSAHVSRRPR